MPLTKMGEFSFGHSNQQDDLYKGMSAAEIKAAFDSRGNELKTVFNNLIDSLQTITDGASGADAIGVTPISTSPSTLQGMLEWLQEQISLATLGQIPDGSITISKLNFDPATQAEFDVAINTIETNSINKANTAETNAKNASVPLVQKGVLNGVATLDGTGNIPTSQLGNPKQVLAGNSPILHEYGISSGSTNATSYTKVAAYTLKGISGQLRISFMITSGSSSYTAYGMIKKNGVNIGTEVSTTSTTGLTTTQDLNGWNDGDTIEFWAYNTGGGGGYSTGIRDVKVGIDTVKKVY